MREEIDGDRVGMVVALCLLPEVIGLWVLLLFNIPG